MKTVLLLIFFASPIFLFSQLNMGVEIAFTHNFFESSNIPTLVSNKSIVYLNYKMKTYTIEAYYSDDFPITSFIDDYAVNYVIDEFGLIPGIIRRFDGSKYFYAGLGGYYRHYSSASPFINLGNKLGLTGKIQFGFEMTKGFNTGITFRSFRDIKNLSKDQTQNFLVQGSMCFTFEVDLTYFYNKKIKKSKH